MARQHDTLADLVRFLKARLTDDDLCDAVELIYEYGTACVFAASEEEKCMAVARGQG